MADNKLILGVELDSKEFERDLGRLSDLGQSTFAAIGIAVAAIGTAFVTAAGKSLQIASNLQEVQNVVDVTFGEAKAQIEEFAAAAGEAYGLSELQAKKYSSTIGAMIKSMGLSSDQVLEMSTTMTGLVGDFASFYNLDHETAFQKIRSGLSGETEPLMQLGINMQVASLEAFALSHGIDKAFASMTTAEKAMLRYNFLLNASKDAQGDFARTAESYANQLRIVGMEVERVSTTFGVYLLPIATQALGTIKEAVQALGEELKKPEIEQAIKNIGTVFSGIFETLVQVLTEAIPPVLQGFALLTEYIDEAGLALSILVGGMVAFKTQAVISAIIAAFGQLVILLKSALTGQLALNAVMAANPIGLVVTAIGALVGAITYLYQTNEEFRKAFINGWNKLLDFLEIWYQAFVEIFINRFIRGYNLLASVLGGDAIDLFRVNLQGLKVDAEAVGKALDDAADNASELDKIGAAAEANAAKVRNLTNEIQTAKSAAASSETSSQEISGIGTLGTSSAADTSGFNLDFIQESYAKDVGKQTAETIGEGIEENSFSISGSITDALNSALSGEQSWSDSFKDMGKNLIQSLADSLLETGLNYLEQAINTVINLVVGSFSDGFGIASPSKVFAKMGYENMRGLAQGLSENASLAINSAKSLTSSLVNAVNLPDLSSYSGLISPASLALPQGALAGGYGGNIFITNTTQVKDTAIETTQSTDGAGNVYIENLIISTTANNIKHGGAIRQAIDATDDRRVTR